MPVYTRIKYLPKSGTCEITYITHYSWNGTYKIMGVVGVGHHDADIEHVTIEIDLDTMLPSRVYFACHSWTEGVWVDWRDTLRDEKEPERILAFVAYHGHGHYCHAGRFIRIFGFG